MHVGASMTRVSLVGWSPRRAQLHFSWFKSPTQSPAPLSMYRCTSATCLRKPCGDSRTPRFLRFLRWRPTGTPKRPQFCGTTRALLQATVNLAFGQQDRTDNRCQAQFGSGGPVPPSAEPRSGRFQANTACPPDNRPPYRQQTTAPFGFSGLTWCSVIGRQR
jgi:hypothetical protein